ncbi:transposase-like zinc-binding domain-containing protein [Comamonas jiangduensis]
MRYGDGAKRYIPCLFRFAMQCPRCNHHHTQKIGLSRHKRQRWMCMGCRRTFGDKDLRLIDPKIKALALAMYAEGIAARKIERLLHVSHNAVLGWVRKEVAGKALQAPTAKDLAVIEADEMWSYVGSKNSPSGCGGQ